MFDNEVSWSLGMRRQRLWQVLIASNALTARFHSAAEHMHGKQIRNRG